MFVAGRTKADPVVVTLGTEIKDEASWSAWWRSMDIGSMIRL